MKQLFCQKRLLVLFYVLGIFCSLMAVSAQTPEKPGFYHHSLENGLQLYVQEDPSSALVRVQLVIRGGYAAQTPLNTGFFELYSRLFFSGSAQYPTEKDESSVLDTIAAKNIQGQTLADASLYEARVPPSTLNDYLHLLSDWIIQPRFTEQALNREFANLKHEVLTRSESVSGFINSAIDGTVYKAAPWKHDSGIYPALFNGQTGGQARLMLQNIHDTWYIPQNAALFVSGNVNSKQVYLQAVEHFSQWSKKTPSTKQPLVVQDSISLKNLPANSQQFILVSDMFSKDFSQLVVQYVNEEEWGKNDKALEATLLASILENDGSTFKTSLAQESVLGLTDPQYSNVSFANKGGNSRLIIQLLMEQQKKVSPLQQIKSVQAILQKKNLYTTAEVLQGKQALLDVYTESKKDHQSFMSSLALAWIYGKANDFFSWPSQVQNIKTESLQNVLNTKPYTFLLLHTSTYAAYKKDFDKNWQLISENTASWYNQALYDAIKKQTNKVSTDIQEKQKAEGSDRFAVAQQYYQNNRSTLKFWQLSSGASLSVKEQPESSKTTILLAMTGGEAKQLAKIPTKPQNRGLETLLLYTLGQKIMEQPLFPKNAELNCLGSMYSGQILIQAKSSDTAQILSAIDQALQDRNFTPVFFDDLIWKMRQDWRTETSQTNFLLFLQSMKSLYKNTPFHVLFLQDADILTKAHYFDLIDAYDEFAKPSKMHLIVSGKIDIPQELLGYFENNSQQLLQLTQTPLPPTGGSQAQLEGKTEKVSIPRIFTSDIPAEKAGPRPLELIPTTTFEDPVQVYFNLPEYGSSSYALLSAALKDFEFQLKKLIVSDKKIAKDVQLFIDPNGTNIGYIQFTSVKNTAQIKPLFIQASEALKDEKSSQDELAVKNRYISAFLADTQSNEGTAKLIEWSVLYAGNPWQYLDHYLLVEASSWPIMRAVFEQWFDNTKFTWFFVK